MKIRYYYGLSLATIIFSVIITISACHKKNTSFDYSQAVETTSDYVEAQQMTNLILLTYFKSLRDSTLQADSIAVIDGAVVTMHSNPNTIKIDYFVWGNYDDYNYFRTGNYIASCDNNFTDPQAVITFSFNNFMYDTDTIVITGFTLNNDYMNNNESPVYAVEIINLTRRYSDTTGTFSYKLNQSFKLIQEQSSPYYSENDYFEISGSLEGQARNGKNFVSNTSETDKLHFYYTCAFMQDGIAKVELPDFIYNGDVNFNNSRDCINKYTIILNETNFEVGYNR
jgi:hypothetical protein